MNTLRSSPSLKINYRISPHYAVLGTGLTDRIMLFGHADGLPINDPYQVVSIQDAVNRLEADSDSPLLLGMLEAYYSGALDIYLVAVAPMSEYEPDLELRDNAYYQQYQERLQDAYDLVSGMSEPELFVPLEAPFNSTVDFLTPLANLCSAVHNDYGEVKLGFLGTRGIIDEGTIDALLQDGRLENLGEAGRHIAVFVGDVTFHLRELPFHHTGSPIAAIAGEMARMPLNRSLTHKPLSSVLDFRGKDIPKNSIELLSEKGYNVIGRNIRGRRGMSFEVISHTDNTFAKEGSDFWSISNMRLMTHIASGVKGIGMTHLGTIGFGLFKKEVNDYLVNLVTAGDIRGYSFDAFRDPGDFTRVEVDINVTPHSGVRSLDVLVHVGPGQ